MKFNDVKAYLTEEERETVYKGPDCRIIKINGKTFSAIFADAPTDKLGSNSHFPFIPGVSDGKSIDKITLMPNDVIVLSYTDGKEVKVTKAIFDKKGNTVAQRTLSKLFTAREKA